VWITDQIFPSQNGQATQLFANGGQATLEDLTIWQLRSAWK
jgi:sucrose-6-phosphate hydrolase SacC (GH32 family)